MLSKKKKNAIIAKFRTHKDDTGSPQVQIAILTEEIKQLAAHLKAHKHDFSSRRGLLRKISLRRRLLKYLRKEDEKAWEKLVKALKLKHHLKLAQEEKREAEKDILEEEIDLNT